MFKRICAHTNLLRKAEKLFGEIREHNYGKNNYGKAPCKRNDSNKYCGGCSPGRPKRRVWEMCPAIFFNKRIFFFILAVILFNSFFTASAFPSEEKGVESAAAPAASSPAKINPPNGAAVISSPKDTTQIVVNVIVNTVPKGDFFTELDDKQNLFIRVQDAKILKLQYAENRIIILQGDEQYIPLSALLDVTATFDEKKLTVVIIGKTTESGKTATDLFSLKTEAKNIYYPRETSAFLNYGLNYIYTNTDGFQSFAVTNKLGFRTGDVFFTSDSLYTKTEDSDNFVRLQSSATYERRGDLQWLVLGDNIAFLQFV